MKGAEFLHNAMSRSLLFNWQQFYGRDFRAVLRDSQPIAYVEMAAGLGVLFLLNLILFREDNWGYFDVNPHPFWLVVIPIAARYGAVPGYAVGFLTAFLYGVFLVFQPRSVFAVDILSTQAILNPVLFFIAGAGLGELREAQKRSHKELAERYDALETDLQDVAQRYLAAVEINREIQRRIVGQTSTVTTLYQAAKALEQLDIEQLSPAVLDLVSTFIEADACALYLRENGKFILKVGRPERVDFPRPTELDTSRGMVAIAYGEKRTVTVRDVIAEATPAQIARQHLLIATPLLGENQEVIGILTVEKVPFLRFTPSAVKLFTLLGDWASSAFQTALRFQQTRDRNVDDELTGAYSSSYMEKRLAEEIVRARYYGLPFSLLALRIDHYQAIGQVQLPRVLQTLAVVFRRHIRPIDVLGRYATEDVFVIALPHLPVEEAQSLAERIQREIAAFGFKPFESDQILQVSIGKAGLAEATASAKALIDDAISSIPREGRYEPTRMIQVR